jgi:signal transduction histidine kinase/CheY-like chemotaxis protein
MELRRAASALKDAITRREQAEKSQFEIKLNLQKSQMEQTYLQEEKKRIQKAKLDAEKANRAKTQFLSNISHEIRTPLNIIMGFTDIALLQAQDSHYPNHFIENLANIKTSSERMLSVINDTLDFNKIEAGKIEVAIETVHIKDLLNELYKATIIQAQQKRQKYQLCIAQFFPETIRTDKVKITQILTNLISNAIKFTPPGKEIYLQAHQEKDCIIYQVCDQGIGIPYEKREIIFRAFEQADKAITCQFGGTGLGLAITRKLVHMLNGHIEISDTEQGGTCFTVKFPFVTEHPVAPTAVEATDDSGIKFSPENTILLVDDDPLNQKLMEAIFTMINLPIHVAWNGKEGVEKAASLSAAGTTPNIILMDIQMPTMGGIEATRLIRSKQNLSNIPVILLSADIFAEYDAMLSSGEIQGYLTKPINRVQLFSMLEKHLKLR